jgi:polyferredoxin
MTQSRRSPRNWRTVGLRRGVQIVFLLLFFVLLILAGGVLREGHGSWLKLFFLFDPLLLLCTLLAAGAVPKLLLLSLATVALTVVLGRVFCGWACPLGTIHDLTGRLLDRLQRRVRHDHWSPWQKSKYYLLVGFLVMAALGGHWIAIWDPLVLLYRTGTVVLWPAAQLSIEQTAAAVRDAAAVEQPLRPKWAEQDEAGQAQQQSSATLKNRLARPVAAVTNPVHGFLKDHVFVVQRQSFLGAGLIAAVFAGLLALNAVRRRFWCRYLCPLGALLGLLAWRPLLRRATQEQSCNQCDLCGQACHGAASAAAGSGWKPSECLGCLNCTASCNRQAMRFTFIWPWQRQPQVETVDLRRRALLGSAVGASPH